MWNKFILILLSVSILSCTNRIVLRKHALEKRTDDIIKYFNENNTAFNTYSIKYGGKFSNSSNKMRFSGVLRIKNDSQIWINISVGFGIEIGRALLTPDSIKFFNRHDKTYFCDDYDYFKRNYDIGVNYKLIQSLLTNSFVLNNAYKSNLVINKDDSATINLNYSNGSKHEASFILNKELNKLTKVIFKDLENNSEMNIYFTDFIDVQHKKLPKQINLEVLNKNSKFSLILKYKKILINGKINTPFRIPLKYKKICP